MLPPGPAVRRSTIEGMEEAPSRSLGRKLIAGIVLVVAAFIILKVLIHTIVWVIGIVVVGVAIIALLWALNTLL
jgi:uncharacterized membrane protein